jgi:hypothetical protein
MDPNARRSRGRNAEADAYWRRRFFTLVAGLGVLGLLAWATTGAVGKPAQQPGGPGSSGNGNESVAAYGSAVPGQPPGGAGQPAGVAGSPTGLPSAQASVSLAASATPSATPSATASAKAPQAQKKAAPGQQANSKAAAGGCPARDIVLTLAVSKTVYRGRALPAFQIDIVSTNPGPCAFNAGRTALRVLITGGTRATWDSGACLRGATPHVEYLQRGVPSVASIVWDRHLRPAGCTTPEVTAPAGQYQVIAVSGSVVSPAKTFVLQ